MKLITGRAVFERHEIEEYAPLWIAISNGDDALLERRRDLAGKLPFVSEVGLMEGTEPLLKELEPFADVIEGRAKSLRPDMEKEDLTRFTFFVLHFDETDIEKVRRSLA